MAVRTKRLVAATVGATTAVVYTTPAGETAIVKNISLRNTAPLLANNALVAVRVAGVDYGILAINLNAGATTLLAPYCVLQPGTSLVVSSSQAGLQVYVSGAELEGVAD